MWASKEWVGRLIAVSRQTFMLYDGWKSVLNEWIASVKHVSRNSSYISRKDPFQEQSIFKKSIAYIQILNDFSLNLLFNGKLWNIGIKKKKLKL